MESNAQSSIEEPKKNTVEDWGLTRTEPQSVSLDRLRIIEPFINGEIGSGSKWVSRHITNSRGEFRGSPTVYSVSVRDRACITHIVKTNHLPPENKMKYRDMIIDNYRAEGGDPKTLGVIGTVMISNPGARNAVINLFASHGKDYRDGGQVEVVPGENGYLEFSMNNAFAQGPAKMVQERADDLGNPSISRFAVISEPDESKVKLGIFDNPDFHVIAFLERERDLDDQHKTV
ncbi:hypothetical protein BJ170DRAFT_724939 [Xylariales sp. AK1849]|nr:hypothetical protein BJ170DRAFT_724939 [Xylariales sp. AK1849]